jgi:hypothetical protein
MTIIRTIATWLLVAAMAGSGLAMAHAAAAAPVTKKYVRDRIAVAEGRLAKRYGVDVTGVMPRPPADPEELGECDVMAELLDGDALLCVRYGFHKGPTEGFGYGPKCVISLLSWVPIQRLSSVFEDFAPGLGWNEVVGQPGDPDEIELLIAFAEAGSATTSTGYGSGQQGAPNSGENTFVAATGDLIIVRNPVLVYHDVVDGCVAYANVREIALTKRGLQGGREWW